MHVGLEAVRWRDVDAGLAGVHVVPNRAQGLGHAGLRSSRIDAADVEDRPFREVSPSVDGPDDEVDVGAAVSVGPDESATVAAVSSVVREEGSDPQPVPSTTPLTTRRIVGQCVDANIDAKGSASPAGFHRYAQASAAQGAQLSAQSMSRR